MKLCPSGYEFPDTQFQESKDHLNRIDHNYPTLIGVQFLVRSNKKK
jgi:hypothetical protein